MAKTLRSTLDSSFLALVAAAFAPACTGASANAATGVSVEAVPSGTSRAERSIPANAGSIACAFEDGTTGSALAVAVKVRVSTASELLGEVTSEEGSCNFPVAPGVYDVTAVISELDYEMRFPSVRVCAGGATPLQLVLDPERSRGKKRTADFDVPCEGF